MSTTDNAFIRAYGHRAVATSNAPATGHATVSSHHLGHSRGPGDRVPVSQVPDASSHLIVPAQEDVAHVAPTREWAEVVSRQFIRWDPADAVMPPAAHFSLAASRATAQAEAEAKRHTPAPEPLSPGLPTTPPPTLEFQPQWEVDQLQWPAVCDRLQRTSQHRLSEIVTTLLAPAHRGPRVIAVTSFGRCEGRTTLALALARLACGINARVGLVDGDIEHADVAQQLSLAFDQGWESWEQHTPLGEVAVVSIREQLTLLPIGPKSGSRAEPQIQQRAQTMLDVLRSHLDLVFVDAGPMYIAAHRWFRSDHPLGFDAALVIRDVRQSNVDQVDDVCCRLIQAGIQDAAIIENFQEQA